jgi:hypothetical protein
MELAGQPDVTDVGVLQLAALRRHASPPALT